MFIPFYVWLSNICTIVKANIEAKAEKMKLEALTDEITKLDQDWQHSLIILSNLNLEPAIQ